jgi:hypothetical protein
MRIFVLFFAFLLVLVSCQTTDQVNNGRMVQKRKYNPGYAWRMAKTIKASSATTTGKVESGHALAALRPTEAETINSPSELSAPEPIAPLRIYMNEDCDRIIFIDGTEKEVHVVEVRESGVAYKNCGQMETGDIIVEPLERVHRIVYAKGTSMLLNDLEEPPVEEKEEKEETVIDRARSETTDTPTSDGEEEPEQEPYVGLSQLVAALLCFFLGAFGIHRFYLGYTFIGLIQLFTAGCCGIWVLVDFIRILTGDLKPANYEDYEEKL